MTRTIPATVPEKWVDITGLMEVLPFKRSRIHYLVHTNQIPFNRVGRTPLFEILHEIPTWVKNNGKVVAA